jgi:acyl carrier protein
MDQHAIDETVRRVISETFCYPLENIVSNTVAEDIDGWDSLRHTILMIRLQKALGVAIPEEIAARASTVGDLIDRLSCLK